MNERLIVTVTEKDAEDGRRGLCHLCPIALAMMRATGAGEVWISSNCDVWAGLDGPVPSPSKLPFRKPDYVPDGPDEFMRMLNFMHSFDDGSALKEPLPLTLAFVRAGVSAASR